MTASTVSAAGDTLSAATAQATTIAPIRTVRNPPRTLRGTAGAIPIARVASGVATNAHCDTSRPAAIPAVATSTATQAQNHPHSLRCARTRDLRS